MGSPEVLPPVDAVLLVSFGGPESAEEVVPFLRNVTAGKGIPDERLAQVGEHYYALGGKSPINDQNRELLAALRSELGRRSIGLPVYWGNRNWQPYLADALTEMNTDGRRRAVAFVTSAHSSYSGCRQYREDMAGAQVSTGSSVTIEKIRQFFDHPGFVEPMADNATAALAELPTDRRDAAHLVFTAHSIPSTMAEASRYEAQLRETTQLVAGRVGDGRHEWQLAFQSRSGSPQTPWLEPDVNDHLRTLASNGGGAVVVVPIGFVSDHIEVKWDLDTEARKTAAEVGISMTRAATVGTDERFVRMIADLVLEHIDERAEQASLGPEGAVQCLAGRCCLPADRKALPTVPTGPPWRRTLA